MQHLQGQEPGLSALRCLEREACGHSCSRSGLEHQFQCQPQFRCRGCLLVHGRSDVIGCCKSRRSAHQKAAAAQHLRHTAELGFGTSTKAEPG